MSMTIPGLVYRFAALLPLLFVAAAILGCSGMALWSAIQDIRKQRRGEGLRATRHAE